jgi:hypothetical protein
MRHLPDRPPVCPWLSAALTGLALAAGLAGAGCATKVVATPEPPPPLVVPVVPPRLVGPVVVEDDAPLPVAEAPAPAPAPPAQRPARPAPRPAGNGAAKPEPAGTPAEGTAKTDTPAEPAPPPPAEPLLRTPETVNDTEAEKRVREILGRAEQNLAKVDYRALTANGRAQADTARRFITQADAALKNRSLNFARYLADKAETLSTSLLNR